MGRFQQRYAPQEKEAVCRAIVVDGLTAARAIEQAAAGELGLPAFTMNLKTAQAYAQIYRERLEREWAKTQSKRTLKDAAPELLALLLDGVGMEVQRLQKGAAAGKANLHRMGQCADVIARLALADNRLNGEKQGPSGGAKQHNSSNGEKGTDAQPLLTRLAQEAKGQKGRDGGADGRLATLPGSAADVLTIDTGR